MKKNKGFSIIELMVAISIAAILTAIAVPSMNIWLNSQKLIASAQQLVDALNSAKSEAISNQSDVVISFATGSGASGAYTIFIDNGTSDMIYGTGDQLLKRGCIKDGVTLYQINLTGGGGTAAGFNLMGLAPGYGGDIRIRSDSASSYRKIILSDSGIIRVMMSSSGSDGTWAE